MFCTIKSRPWLIFFFVSLWFPCIAQENTTGFWQSSFALNYTVSKNYTHNFTLQNRNFIYSDSDFDIRVRQLDLGHFSNLKIAHNQSVALGALYRLRDVFDGGASELRLTQQYNLSQKPFVVRYGHRFRSQQRITSALTTHRFRYRFSLDFPLQGEQLDVGEAYFVGNVEQLLSAAKTRKPQHDTRFTIFIGWQLTEKMKLQLGTEYRFEDYGQQLQNVFFLLSNVNISL